MIVIRILNRVDGGLTGFNGKYVAKYDPTAHWPDGSYDGGILEVTEDPAKALQFRDAMEATETWKRMPGCKSWTGSHSGSVRRSLTARTTWSGVASMKLPFRRTTRRTGFWPLALTAWILVVPSASYTVLPTAPLSTSSPIAIIPAGVETRASYGWQAES